MFDLEVDLPRGPVTVPEVVVVPVPLLLVEPLAEDVPPLGPLTVADPDFPWPVLVVEPFTFVVPPFGPVTEPLSAVPLRVLLTVPDPLTDLPRALVALPLPDTVLPLPEAEPVAVPPCRPVAVCCANAEGTANIKTIAARFITFFMGSLFD